MTISVMLSTAVFVVFLPKGLHGHAGHHSGLPPNAYSISKHDAYSFLRTKRSSRCNTDEPYCEANKPTCMMDNEDSREYYCSISNPCTAGQTCYLSTPCPAHYVVGCSADDPCLSIPCFNSGTCKKVNSSTFTCDCPPGFSSVSDCLTETDECASNPCQHGGQCTDHFNWYSCSCLPGYTGVNCETDINECASDPCQNGGFCNDLINNFQCDCVPRYNGTVCEKDCRPGPADILFILDSSVSAHLNRSIDYVKSFVSQVPIGPNDFQVGVITYSYDAKVEFSFNAHADNETLLTAIDNLQSVRGPTFTAKALHLAIEVLTNTSYGTRTTTAPGYIVLMTDGMSTDRKDAYQIAASFKYRSITLMTVGIGKYVDHKEMIGLAEDSKYMFSSTDSNALNTILMETSHPDCIDCTRYDKVDLVFVVGVSNNRDLQKYTKTMKQLVTLMNQENYNIYIGAVSYSTNPKVHFELQQYNEDEVKRLISRISTSQGQPDTVAALNFTGNNGFTNSRVDAVKMVVLLSNGQWNDIPNVRVQIEILEQLGIKVIVIGVGDKIDENLIEMTSDSYRSIYVSNDEDIDRLYGIVSEATQIQCASDVFNVRQ